MDMLDARRRLRRELLGAIFVLASSQRALAKDIYVAPAGKDDNAGTMDAPFATVAKAQSVASPGDTVFLRDGTYAFTSSTASDGLDLTKSGTAGKPISYVAYGDEKPVFDFAGMTAAARIKGINVTASYIVLRGIEMKNVPQNITTAHESWCIYNDGGSNNIYDRLDLHHNMGPGLFIVHGANNLVQNCDSHHNYDPKSSTGPGTNADGFGCHVNKAGDTGNVFRGCRAWWNSDDGYDLIQAQEPVVIESSWAWYNGYMPDSTSTASGGDGNGFKAGGYGVPATNVPATPPSHTVRLCVGFRNRAAGFYQNHHPVSDHFYNNTAYSNASSNFNLLGLNGNVGILRNNVAFGGTLLANASGVDDMTNSWNLPVTVSAADFQSVDLGMVAAPRKADGSLPDIPFMKLASGSDLIDKGVDVGLPFNGSAPDLGAFESGPPLGTGGSGAGGAPSTGGGTGAGGAPSGGAAGNSGAQGGGGASAGGVPSAGATGSGAAAPGGGAVSSGGVASGGGRGPASGGAPSSNGGTSSGAAASGGTVSGIGGQGATAGAENAPENAASGDGGGGCTCRTAVERVRSGNVGLLATAIALGFVVLRRRRTRS